MGATHMCCDSKEGFTALDDEDGPSCSIMRPGSHFICDAQHFLCASARGRLAELGHLDDDLRSAPHLFEPVDGDPVCRVRCSQALWPSGANPQQIIEESVKDCEALGPVSGKLELMACSDFQAICSVTCGEALVSLRPTKATKLFAVHCPELQSATSIDLRLDGGSMQINAGFGLRLRGYDLLSRLRVVAGDEAVEDIEDPDAFVMSLSMQAAHHGSLQPLPLGYCYRAECSVEFLAYGLEGTEELQIFVNGITTCCGRVILGAGPQQRRLVRFDMSPVCCEIRSLTLSLRLNAGSGCALDPQYGLRFLGCDMLPGTHFIDRKTYQLNPHGWTAESPQQQALTSGQWTWEGYYYVLAYRRTKRPYVRTLLTEKETKVPKESKELLPL